MGIAQISLLGKVYIILQTIIKQTHAISLCDVLSSNSLTIYLSNMFCPLFCVMVQVKCFPVRLKSFFLTHLSLFINTMPTLLKQSTN